MEGGSLFDYIVSHPQGRLGDDETRHIFVQLVEGLRYIHSKGIVHRDLKPENILIDSTTLHPGFPEVKLSDFGHSKLIRDGYTHAQSTVGTRQYWAPEVADPSSDRYDERADLWSLGVVLYVMLMGRCPFDSDGPKTDFAFRGSRYADELIRGLIRIRPEERITLEQCLQSHWVLAKSSTCPGQLAKLPSNSELHRPELRLRIPRAPRDISSFKADLCTYSRKHKAAANLLLLEVVVCFCVGAEEEGVREARDELTAIIACHVPGFKADVGEALDEETMEARAIELESLQAIYDSELDVVNETEWSVQIRKDVVFRVQLTPGYPLTEPPAVSIEGGQHILPGKLLDDLLAEWHPGDFSICQWAESIRDALGPDAEGTSVSLRSRFQRQTGEWAKNALNGIAPGEKREFPTSLTAYERMVLHRLCDKLGWEHESYDVEAPSQRKAAKPLRQLVVTRPRKGAPEVKNLDFSLKDFLPPPLRRNPKQETGNAREASPNSASASNSASGSNSASASTGRTASSSSAPARATSISSTPAPARLREVTSNPNRSHTVG